MKHFIIILGVLGCSLSAIFARWAEVPSLVLVFYRMLFASLLLLPVLFIKYRAELKSLSGKQLLWSAVSGVFLGLHFLCYFSSLELTSISASVVLVDTEVFFVSVAGVVVFHQWLSRKAWMCIFAAFFGSVIICAGDGVSSGAFFGNLIALAGAASMAVYTMIGSRIRKDVTTVVYTTVVYLVGTMTTLIILLITKTPLTGYPPQGYLAGFGLAVFCTLLGHSVFSWGLKWLNPSFISMAKLLEPVFASVLGMLLFAEMPGWNEYLGGAVVIAGLIFYILTDSEHNSL